ncbi:hypothetical protein JHK82_044943 [Glycine max]|nr:hypothetical protein JHK82_044943 [Glycine max]
MVPPLAETLKMNVDGSCLYPSLNIGTGGDALKAETLALCHGLQLAWNNVVSNLCLESDNLQLVEIINSKVYLPFHQYDSLLLVILDYIEGRPS